MEIKAREVDEAQGALGFEVEPELEAPNVEQIIALRELFQPVPVDKIRKAYKAADNAVVSHHIPVRYHFDLLKLVIGQAFKNQEEAILVEELDSFLTALEFFLDVSKSVLVDILVHLCIA